VCAVIQAAHDAGKMAIVHVQQERTALEAMDCGANGLAHAFPDQVADTAFIESAKRRHVFVLSTLDVWAAASGMDLTDRLAADPRVARCLSAAQKETLLARDKTTVLKFFSNAVANVRLLHRAGVPILAGTDAPNPGTAHGASLHEELQILVSAGFTPVEALHSATALPDKVFGLGDRSHIAVGDRADLLLVNGNPAEDIRSTLNIERIWKNGYPVDRNPPRSH
jgi:imidazolonepropionase-like amidohydrolase